MKRIMLYALVMCIAVIAFPAMAAPVDLRSTMQNDQSEMLAASLEVAGLSVGKSWITLA